MWKTPSVIIISVVVLLAFGIVMLTGAGKTRGESISGDPYYFAKRQCLWLLVGSVLAVTGALVDYRLWKHGAVLFFAVSGLMLVLVLVPGIGVKIGGSRRWLHFGPAGFQPLEVTKFTLVLFLSWWFTREKKRASDFLWGFFVPGIAAGLVMLLIIAEPDFGTTMLTGAVAMSVMFVGGSRILYLAPAAAAGLGLGALYVMHDPVRWARVVSYLNPEKYAQTYSFQLINAINAFILGGLNGMGLGKSVQKHYYLPEAHTDFIFAIIGEELGLFASLGVLALFLTLLICGIIVSCRAPDKFGQLLAFGLTMLITLQAVINMGVVTGCLPTKGLPLPFISFGGTSISISMLSIGILINIASKCEAERHAPESWLGMRESRRRI